MASSSLGRLTGQAKLDAVTALLDKLSKDLTEKDLSEQERLTALEELKIYGRDPNNAGPIFKEKGIGTLLKHALDSSSESTSRGALRCLANALFLKPETRQIFVSSGYLPKACDKLANGSWEDEFLLGRVLLLSTYGTDINLQDLIDNNHLAETLVQKLAVHASRTGTATTVDPMVDMALGETAKLFYNLTHFCPERTTSLTPAVPHIASIFLRLSPNPTRPLDPPIGSLINTLLNLDLTAEDAGVALFGESHKPAFIDKFMDVIDSSLKLYKDSEVESSLTPPFGVMRKVYDAAPESVRAKIQQRLLPTAGDRETTLGRGDSLAARLLRASTDPAAEKLADEVSHLLFEMSDRDAAKFVSNIGYGFASGYLFKNNIPVPDALQDGQQSSSRSGDGRPVNPVTGQFIDAERYPDIPDMTEEQKEREAERLFVLFERLRATGVVDIENPVAQAMREGRFENIDDKNRFEEVD